MVYNVDSVLRSMSDFRIWYNFVRVVFWGDFCYIWNFVPQPEGDGIIVECANTVYDIWFSIRFWGKIICLTGEYRC